MSNSTYDPQISDLIPPTHDFVFEYMSQPTIDSSHDFSHILRVVHLAQQIYTKSPSSFQSRCNPTLITLLAYLHDIGDKKYSSQADLYPVESFLLSHGASKELSSLLQLLVKNVSYSNEQRFPDKVATLCAAHPELAVVQDADRLDAMGAIGIARAFTYGTAKRPQDGWKGVLQHYEEKLAKLEGDMKTEVGKEMAKVRGERLRKFFEEWWVDEVSCFGMMPAR